MDFNRNPLPANGNLLKTNRNSLKINRNPLHSKEPAEGRPQKGALLRKSSLKSSKSALNELCAEGAPKRGPITFQGALFHIFGADEFNGATVGAPSRTRTHQQLQEGARLEQNVALFAEK